MTRSAHGRRGARRAVAAALLAAAALTGCGGDGRDPEANADAATRLLAAEALGPGRWTTMGPPGGSDAVCQVALGEDATGRAATALRDETTARFLAQSVLVSPSAEVASADLDELRENLSSCADLGEKGTLVPGRPLEPLGVGDRATSLAFRYAVDDNTVFATITTIELGARVTVLVLGSLTAEVPRAEVLRVARAAAARLGPARSGA